MSKVVALIGMGPGVAAGVARRFALEGYRIAAVARGAGVVDQVSALRSAGYTADAYQADASDPAAIANTLARIGTECGPVDVLVYNAAGIRHKPLAQLAASELMADLTVSVGSALAAVQAVLPSMRKQGKGTLLFTGGGFAVEPDPEYATVGIGKAALRNLAFSLFADLKESGVHAATVTIAGFVKPGTALDPDRIAEAFWTLHQQPPAGFEREAMLTGE